jgi:hypothetical protein
LEHTLLEEPTHGFVAISYRSPIFGQSPLHHIEVAFDEPDIVSSFCNGSLSFIFFIEIAEKTQANALKYLVRMWVERYDFHLMICHQWQSLRLHVDGAMIHQ